MLAVVEYQSRWPSRFEALAREVREALGPTALRIDHIGSTAVPGLPAKDVIDIDLTVPDPCKEGQYVPQLESLGYVLTVREPSFYEHRMFRLAEPRVNLHVFGPESPENARHLMFRDWLREHSAAHEEYAMVKRQAASGASDIMDYNERKQAVVRGIYNRIFAHHGLLP